MCDRCIVEGVKQDMLSRRRLFQAAGGAAAAAVVAPAAAQSPPPAAPQTAKPQDTKLQDIKLQDIKLQDMTHELHPDFPTYFGPQQFFMEQKFRYSEHKFNLFELRVNEHTGTHIDAPLHFSADGGSVAEIPVQQLVAPLVNIDIRERAAADPDAQLTPDDVKAWTAKNGPLPQGCCVAMNSGWDAHVASAKFRNAGDDKVMHFPGFHVETAKMLLEDGAAVGVASDTLSLDFGRSPDFAVHYAWLAAGRWGVECIAGLGALPAKGATVFVGAPKVRGGTGGPCRIIAMV